ncbi:MAG: hypothetical protein AAF353_06005 [Pseudomonadota bacterium]
MSKIEHFYPCDFRRSVWLAYSGRPRSFDRSIRPRFLSKIAVCCRFSAGILVGGRKAPETLKAIRA